MLSKLKKGDEVITGGGIFGRLDHGLNSGGWNAAWTGATAASPTNPAGTFDTGFGYGRKLGASERLSKWTAHMETLSIYCPVVLRDEAVMRIHWGEMALPVRIKAPWRPPEAR